MDRGAIAERVKALRIRSGETQKQLANAVGITDMAISQYESGARVPTDDVKMAIAKHYGVSVDSIFFATKVNQTNEF